MPHQQQQWNRVVVFLLLAVFQGSALAVLQSGFDLINASESSCVVSPGSPACGADTSGQVRGEQPPLADTTVLLQVATKAVAGKDRASAFTSATLYSWEEIHRAKCETPKCNVAECGAHTEGNLCRPLCEAKDQWSGSGAVSKYCFEEYTDFEQDSRVLKTHVFKRKSSQGYVGVFPLSDEDVCLSCVEVHTTNHFPQVSDRNGYTKDVHPEKWANANEDDFMPAGLGRAAAEAEHLFPELVSPESQKDLVRQGEVGDCWLVATLACLAMYPKAVREIFEHTDLPAGGVFTLQLFDIHYGWMRISTNDQVPQSAGGTPQYTKVNRAGAVWPLIVEKAFAKKAKHRPPLAVPSPMFPEDTTGASENPLANRVGYGTLNAVPASGHPKGAVYAMQTLTADRSITLFRHAVDKDTNVGAWKMSSGCRAMAFEVDFKDRCKQGANTIPGQEDAVRDIMWNAVMAGYATNKLMPAACCRKDIQIHQAQGRNEVLNNQLANALGIVDKHQYSILAVKDIKPGMLQYCVRYETPQEKEERLQREAAWANIAGIPQDDELQVQVVMDSMCKGAGTGHFVPKELNLPEGTPLVRLIKVRNPWGSDTKFNGDWSDDSPLWDQHPELKKALGFVKARDGVWWMKFEDFFEYFDHINIGSQDMLEFHPPPPECNTPWGAAKFHDFANFGSYKEAGDAQSDPTGYGSAEYSLTWPHNVMNQNTCAWCKWVEEAQYSSNFCKGTTNQNPVVMESVTAGQKLCCRPVDTQSLKQMHQQQEQVVQRPNNVQAVPANINPMEEEKVPGDLARMQANRNRNRNGGLPNDLNPVLNRRGGNLNGLVNGLDGPDPEAENHRINNRRGQVLNRGGGNLNDFMNGPDDLDPEAENHRINNRRGQVLDRRGGNLDDLMNGRDDPDPEAENHRINNRRGQVLNRRGGNLNDQIYGLDGPDPEAENHRINNRRGQVLNLRGGSLDDLMNDLDDPDPEADDA